MYNKNCVFMTNLPTSLGNLRKNGMRITPQRVAVLHVLLNKRTHPNAQDIWTEVRVRFPKISFATVYNTLNMLSELGEIRAMHMGKNSTLFDPRTDLHRHFCCQKCGNVIDIEENESSGPELEGHLVQSCQIIYYGECTRCRYPEQT